MAGSGRADPQFGAVGIATVTSRRSVSATVERLMAILAERGLKTFVVIDHSGAAREAGIAMPDTKVVVFGSPVAGSPLMLAAPSLALDLPLRILVAAGDDGVTRVSYTDGDYLASRHRLDGSLAGPLRASAGVVEALVAD